MRLAWLSLALAGCGGAVGASDLAQPPTDGGAVDAAGDSSVAGDGGACAGPASFAPAWLAAAKPSRVIHVAPTGDDANDGSAAKPLKTSARAFSLLAPGVELDFAAGGYACPPSVQNLAASTANPAIVRSSDGPRAAKFDCAGQGDFYFSRATGVVLDGLEIANAAGHGVQLDSGNPFDPSSLSGDFVLVNAFVHDTQLAGIKVAQSRRVWVLASEFARTGAGRQCVEFVATDAVTIVGNDAHESDAFDEVKGGAHGGVIAWNRIHDMRPGGGGILVGGDCTGTQFLGVQFPVCSSVTGAISISCAAES